MRILPVVRVSTFVCSPKGLARKGLVSLRALMTQARSSPHLLSVVLNYPALPSLMVWCFTSSRTFGICNLSDGTS